MEIQLYQQFNGLSEQQQKQQTLLLSQAKTDEEKNIAISFTAGRKLNSLSDKKQDKDAIVKALAKWRIMLGISKEPSVEEYVINCGFVLDNYGHMTLMDMDIAINLALVGKLGFQVETYNSFAPLLISKILNAYENYKRRMVNELHAKAVKAIEAEQSKPKEKTVDEKVTHGIQYLLHLVSQVKNKKPISNLGNAAWDIAVRCELVKDEDAEDLDAMEYALKRVQSDEHRNVVMEVFGKMVIATKKETVDSYRERYAKEFVLYRIFSKIALLNQQEFTDWANKMKSLLYEKYTNHAGKN